MTINRRVFFGVPALGLGAAVAAVADAGQATTDSPPRIETLTNGLRIHIGDDVTAVRVAHAGVASIVKAPRNRIDASGGFFATAGEPVRIMDLPDRVRMTGPDIVVEAFKSDGRLRFCDLDGQERLAEAEAEVVDGLDGVSIARRQGFEIGADEQLSGLGQFREPLRDYRDRDVFLAHANSDAIVPFLATTGGWGLLWDTNTAAYMRSRGRDLAFHSVAGEVVRYHVCLGEGLEGVIRRYRALTGAAALLPKWAYGYWQSKERYSSQAELTGVVEEYDRRGLPIDAVVLDWRYWGENDQFSGMTFDPVAFPDPRAMVDRVHDRDVHLLASIWPAFGPDTTIARDMAAGDHLFASPHWSGGRVFDVSSPAARAIYWKHIKAGLIDIGFDGLWTDGNEPEFQSTGGRYGTARSFADNGRMSIGPISENLLTYSYIQAEGLSTAMARDVADKRPVILSRSAYAGQQAFGAITWSGDIFASWGTLTNQIVAAQQFSLAGDPWWTCDIGAFLVFHRYPDGLDDPAYKELYVRWFQFGAFLPVFRAHGTHVPRELWRFGEPGTPHFDALAAALQRRYTLAPYIYSTAAAVALEGDSFLRPLAMDYPGDPAADEPAAFMTGRDLLVRIVDKPMENAGQNLQEFIPNHAVVGDEAPAATVNFYEGADFDRLISSRLTDDIKMTWSGDLPGELSGKPYSMRWSGRIVAQESGPHQFSVMGKGAIKLLFDGRVVVDGAAVIASADGATGAVSFKEHAGDARFTFDVTLEKGRGYPFVLEQRQAAADVVSLWLEWITPTQVRRMTVPSEPAVSTRLPRGHDWFDYETGERYAGGTLVRGVAALGAHPLFARAGAIIPTSPGRRRMSQTFDRLTLRVFTGRDGQCTLYDDAGDGQGHLNGQATRIVVRWTERTRTLEIGDRIGRYVGMSERIAMTIEVVDGKGQPGRREIGYDGGRQSIIFGST